MMPRIQMGWQTPPYLAAGDAEADVIAFTLGAGKSSHLYRKLVYELELAQRVSAGQESLALRSIFTITITGRSRSSSYSLTWGRPVRAVTRQSILRISSPG